MKETYAKTSLWGFKNSSLQEQTVAASQILEI